ncbi:hypothetical protein ACFQE5_07030 [Pseudonocardia hispaniensis]|uniref:Ogr/Delta-like zinc finger protein n=1 Tax=Pseudonocardia hispaniensis TaxID=904933 RepID=A0ABW1IZS3_9PSEU
MTLRGMRCAQCGWPSEETEVLSTHHTSEGWVRYRRCACGEVSIEVVTLADRRGTHSQLVHDPAAAALPV